MTANYLNDYTKSELNISYLSGPSIQTTPEALTGDKTFLRFEAATTKKKIREVTNAQRRRVEFAEAPKLKTRAIGNETPEEKSLKGRFLDSPGRDGNKRRE